MKFGILSDSHGNLGGLVDAVDFLTGKLEVKKIFHLGHDYADVDELVSLKRALSNKKVEKADEDDTAFFSDLAEALTTTLDLSTRTVLKATEGDKVNQLKHMIVRVPGDGDAAYASGEHAHLDFEMLGDRIIGLVHNVKELKKEDIATVHVVFYGGSHLYQVDRVGHRWFINPGHLMKQPEKGREATFGYLDASNADLPVFRIYGLDGSVKLEKELSLDKKNKFSVTS
jgi:predicted phosphodiesterase